MDQSIWLRGALFFSSLFLVTSHGDWGSNSQQYAGLIGGCELPDTWAGKWFQQGSGKPSIVVNSTHIESKGHCISSEGDKFLFHDKVEKCYRCLVMHKKHQNVLQYKESYCMPDHRELCNEITGDAVLLSMFRVDGTGVACPFKLPPFSVVYSKGQGECSSPPSRADPCTDETRLVFRFQACPDIVGTESVVEELECLATWREGTYHYLVGRLHHKNAMSEEERFRCFLYHKQDHNTYIVAQSGEATCSGLLGPNEGSRNMKLTKMEGTHTKCKFPTWLTQHYHWRSLDYSHSFHFSHRNATLKISSRNGLTETKLMCHSVVSEKGNIARIIVHVISGCMSGYKCMTLLKRDTHLIQMQQSDLYPDPELACASTAYELASTDTITMITGNLPSVKCPLEGRYSPVKAETQVVATGGPECEPQQTSLTYKRVLMACSPKQDTMDFEPTCRTDPKSSYSCHGSWKENATTYIVGSPVSRHSTDARHYCFILTHTTSGITIERVAETCAVAAKQTDWAYNITEVGKCAESSSGVRQPNLLLLLTLPVFTAASLYLSLR